MDTFISAWLHEIHQILQSNIAIQHKIKATGVVSSRNSRQVNWLIEHTLNIMTQEDWGVYTPLLLPLATVASSLSLFC